MAEYDLLFSIISAYDSPLLTDISLFIDTFTYPLLALLILYLFFIRRDRRRAVSIALTYVVLVITIVALKFAFADARPCSAPWKISCPLDYGLPSGHSAAVAVLLVAYLAAPSFPAVLLVYIAVCLSRVYLGVHIFKDILAGTAIAFVIFLLVDRAVSRYLPQIGREAGRK